MLASDQLLMEMIRRQKMRAALSKALTHMTACMHIHTQPHVGRSCWELGFFATDRTVSGYIWQRKRSQLVWAAWCLCWLPMTVTAADDWNVGTLAALTSEAKDWNTTGVLPAPQQLLQELQRVVCCNPDRCLAPRLCFVCFLCLCWLVLTVYRVFLWFTQPSHPPIYRHLFEEK